jgi:spermidine/putrescine transport system substrate-binding protein
MTTKPYFGRMAVIPAVLALVLAACGDGGTASEEPDESVAASMAPAESEAAEPSAEAPSGKLVVSNWDGYMPPEFADEFEAATGIEVELALHTTNEDIMGKLEAANGGGFDVVFVSAPFAEILNARGWAAQLDHAQIPNLENLSPEASELDYDPGNAFSVPYTWGTTGLCYRTDLVTEEIDSWADLLQPAEELQGKITMLATDRWLLLPAQKLLGYSVNSTDEAELTEARDLLIEAKDNLLAYDDTTFYSRLVSGEAWLVEAWDGWCNYGIAEDPNIGWVVPEEGSDLWVDTMVVLESSENKAAAHAFIDYILRPEIGAWAAENILYKVPNAAAMESLDPSLIEAFPNLGTTPEELFENEVMRDVGDALPTYTRIVSEVTAS